MGRIYRKICEHWLVSNKMFIKNVSYCFHKRSSKSEITIFRKWIYFFEYSFTYLWICFGVILSKPVILCLYKSDNICNPTFQSFKFYITLWIYYWKVLTLKICNDVFRQIKRFLFFTHIILFNKVVVSNIGVL